MVPLPERPITEKDTANFVQLVDDYGDELLRLCTLYLRDVQLAEDAVQEVFFSAYRHLHQFRGESGIRTWLTRIAINTCKNLSRGRTAHPVCSLDGLIETLSEEEPDLRDDTVLRAVLSLRPKYREVILLFYYRELRIREIASILRLPQSTVSVRLKRAREALRPKLKGWYFDE